MNAVSGIFAALALVFGGGYALDQIYVATKLAALARVHRGMPHLSDFTNRLTGSKIDRNGALVPAACGRHKASPRK